MSGESSQPTGQRKRKKDETSDPLDSSRQFARMRGSLLPVVLLLRGEADKPFYVLGAEVSTGGRGEGNPILLDDPSCSRVHFAFLYENASSPDKVPVVYIEDRGSRNGTMVNGVRITSPVRLKFGDRIQAGNTIMCFVIRTVGEVEAESGSNGQSKTDTLAGNLQTARVVAHCPAVLTLNLPDQTGTPLKVDGLLEDVSLSGMRFRSLKAPDTLHLDALRPMRTGRISAQLPGYTSEIDCTGRIAWIHKDGAGCVMLGLEIHGIAPTAQETLMRYIISNST